MENYVLSPEVIAIIKASSGQRAKVDHRCQSSFALICPPSRDRIPLILRDRRRSLKDFGSSVCVTTRVNIDASPAAYVTVIMPVTTPCPIPHYPGSRYTHLDLPPCDPSTLAQGSSQEASYNGVTCIRNV